MKKADFIKVLINKTMLLEDGHHYSTCAGAERTINMVLECGNRQYPEHFIGVKTDTYELDVMRNGIKKCVTIRWHDKTYMEAVTFRLSFSAFDEFCKELESALNSAEKEYFFKAYALEIDDIVLQARKDAVAEHIHRAEKFKLKKTSGDDKISDVYEVAKPWGDTLD